MKLLHIDSSALGSQSVSRELSAAIVDAFQAREPGLAVTYRDLAAAPLPHWAPGTGEADAGNDPLAEFLAADIIVIGAPMYNFSVPSQLKSWIDRIVVAGKTFSYGANGPQGLAGGRKVVIASSRGGFYGAESGREDFDFQEAYLRQVFGFIGVSDIEFVRAEGIGLGAEQRAKSIADARAGIDGQFSIAA